MTVPVEPTAARAFAPTKRVDDDRIGHVVKLLENIAD